VFSVRLGRKGVAMSVTRLMACGSALLLSLLVPAVADAGRYGVRDLRALSGPSPFTAGCPGAAFDATNITGHELESTITVSPSNPRHIVAAWKQDVGPDSTRSDLVASSRDRGRTWTRHTIPGLSRCTGGIADGATDPWLSAGPSGTVYFIGGALFLSAEPAGAIVASRSTDDGRTWAIPATVAPPDTRNDKPAVTADPARRGRAYAIWANWDRTFNFPFANLLLSARTDDGGATWSEPVAVDAPPSNALDQASVIVVLGDGTLVAVYTRQSFFPDFTATQQFLASRSRDGGRTWLPPVEIASMPLQPFSDPETGEELPSPQFVTAAAGKHGDVYVAWEHDASAAAGGIDVATSRDGARTWSVYALPGVSAYAFEPSLAVDSHGTVGLTWYDLRNDRPGDAALTADVWFAHSHRGRAPWHQTHVAGPTDLRTAPLPRHNRVGEYQGLAALGGQGFAAIFTLAAPLARNGPTDVFFARIAPGHCRHHGRCNRDGPAALAR
jgi:hypothetical protein